MSAIKTRHVGLRFAADHLDQIDHLARQHKLNRTDYITQAALGRLDRVGLEDRIQRIDQRLQRLEALSYGE